MKENKGSRKEEISYLRLESGNEMQFLPTEECKIAKRRSDKISVSSYFTLVQSLKSPFFPPHIGAEPGRAKRESRITCMYMLRTKQSKITRPLSTRAHTTLLKSTCRAIPFSARALKKKISLTLILW